MHVKKVIIIRSSNGMWMFFIACSLFVSFFPTSKDSFSFKLTIYRVNLGICPYCTKKMDCCDAMKYAVYNESYFGTQYFAGGKYLQCGDEEAFFYQTLPLCSNSTKVEVFGLS